MGIDNVAMMYYAIACAAEPYESTMDWAAVYILTGRKRKICINHRH